MCAVAVTEVREFCCGKNLSTFVVSIFLDENLHGVFLGFGDNAFCRKGSILVFGHGRCYGDISLRLNACAAVQKSVCGRKRHILAGVKERTCRVLNGICREGKLCACCDAAGGMRVKSSLYGIYDTLLCIVRRPCIPYLFFVGRYFLL